MAVVTAYEIVIGLEVHAQLLTKSKMFCPCRADYANAEPNTHICPVCMGMPGVLPVINEQAIVYTVMTALALNCSIPPYSKFDRKNYPYPDLVKGYQISQYDRPLSRNGFLTITFNGAPKRIGITRIHLEEDTARLLHRTENIDEPYSLIDVNRSGVPLIEIVSEPDMRSAEEARLYLQKLRAILQYLGVSDGKMEEGSMRCDANISIRPRGSKTLGVKVEIKNMNSFRAVERALKYEAERQIKAVEAGETLFQETRGWVEEKEITVGQRSKEMAHDYRYFPEPDLPPLVLQPEWIENIRQHLPELPDAKRQRFIEQYELPAYDAELLTNNKTLADFFEAAIQASKTTETKTRAKSVSNWLLGEFTRLLNLYAQEMQDTKLTPAGLASLLELLETGMISGKMAKVIFEKMYSTGRSAGELAQEGGPQMSDRGELEKIVRAVVAANPKVVADYRSGKPTAAQYFFGPVMKETKGKANPVLLKELITEILEQE